MRSHRVFFSTDLNSGLLQDTGRGRELLRSGTPMKRYGKAEETVGSAILLASEAAAQAA